MCNEVFKTSRWPVGGHRFKPRWVLLPCSPTASRVQVIWTDFMQSITLAGVTIAALIVALTRVSSDSLAAAAAVPESFWTWSRPGLRGGRKSGSHPSSSARRSAVKSLENCLKRAAILEEVPEWNEMV